MPGVYNSLAQVVLKATAPGVPDFYQGTELWDLSLVDPDNRRPVDLRARGARCWPSAAGAVNARGALPALYRRTAQTPGDGALKLLVTARVLAHRRRHRDLVRSRRLRPAAGEGARAPTRRRVRPDAGRCHVDHGRRAPVRGAGRGLGTAHRPVDVGRHADPASASVATVHIAMR